MTGRTNAERVEIIKKRVSIPISVSSPPGFKTFNITWPEAFPDDTYLVNLKLPDAQYWAQITSKILYKTPTYLQIALGFLDVVGTTPTYSGTMTVDAVWVGYK